MLSKALFISDKVEERTIELADGTVEVVHFKHLTSTQFELYALWSNSADENVVATATARLLVVGVCEPDGTPALDLANAEKLKRPVMQRLLRALLEVNGYFNGKKTGKD